jgi:glycosyltransferase involved in cell wall biosynthesis
MKNRVKARNRVVHLSTVHPWHDHRILRRECRSLARAGYDVQLLAVGDSPREVDGVRVKPLAATRRRRRLLVGVPRALRLALRQRAAVYHLHDPELGLGIPLLRLRGARVVYDAHEDLPAQILDKSYLPRASRPVLAIAARALCWFIDLTSDHVITATPTIARRFPRTSTTVLYNYPDLDDVAASLDQAGPRHDSAVYLGAITAARGVGQVVDAIALTPRTVLNRLLLIGPCPETGLIERLSDRPGWARVDYSGRLERQEAWALMASARLGLVVFQPTRAHRDALPNKIFEYMAAGIPVVASNFPAWRQVIGGTGCGLLVDPTDPRAIAAAIQEIASDPDRAREMGQRGRRAVRERFNWAGQSQLLERVYARLTS